MKKSLNLYIIICAVWISVLSCESTQAQSFEELITYSDSLFAKGDYETAMRTYQRLLFFSNGRQTQYIYYRLANSYQNIGEFDKASFQYDLAWSATKSDSLRADILVKKSQCYMMQRKWDYAIMELLNINDSISVNIRKRVHFYLGINYFYKNQLEKSKNYFLNCLEKNDSIKKQNIISLFENKKALNKPNPKKAMWLSVFLPGAGQLYCRDYRNAINSSAITTLFLAIGVRMTLRYSFLDAFIAVFPWFQRYYMGGYLRAEKTAIQKREENRLKILNEIIQIIEY